MTRTKAFAVLGALVMFAAACSGDPAPLTPQPASPAAEVSLDWRSDVPAADIGEGNTLLRATPLARDITVSQIIGPAGGQLEIPATGLRVYVPRGAVSRQTTITATALKGDQVAYEFGPHGTRFGVPLVMVQSTVGTNANALPAGTVVQLGYFTSPDALDRVAKKARVAEFIPQLGLVFGDAIAFPIWHFSGYIPIWAAHGSGRDDDR
jgi:hypothetical protein